MNKAIPLFYVPSVKQDPKPIPLWLARWRSMFLPLEDRSARTIITCTGYAPITRKPINPEVRNEK